MNLLDMIEGMEAAGFSGNQILAAVKRSRPSAWRSNAIAPAGAGRGRAKMKRM